MKKLLICAGFLTLLMAIPFVASSYFLYILTLSGIFIIASFAQNLVTGYSGQLSFANVTFFAFGSYIAAFFVTDIELGYWPVLPAAILFSAVVALLIGFPLLRLHGFYLAIGSLAFVFITEHLLVNWDTFLDRQGVYVARPGPLIDDRPYYYFVFTCIVICLFIGRNILRSHTGRVMAAIRENEVAAQSLGVDLTKYKLLAVVLGAMLTSIAGALYSPFAGYITPPIFGFNMAIMLLAMIVIGGVGSIMGSIIGALFVVLTPEILRLLPEHIWFIRTRGLTPAIYGIMIIVVLLYSPKGLAALLGKTYKQGSSQFPRGAGLGNIEKKIPDFSNDLDEDKGSRGQVVLEVEELSINFGGLKALEGVYLNLCRGEILGLIGPNGAGKTTALNCITGYYRPEVGSIKFNEKQLLNRKPHQIVQMGITRTFQNVELFGSLTVMETMMIAQHRYLKSGLLSQAFRTGFNKNEERRSRDRAGEILHYLGLIDFLDKVVSTLPYVTQKLVSIGRALIVRPEILLLDEPASGMNIKDVNNLGRLIQNLWSDFGITTLLVEHNMNLVMDVCHRICVLDFGRLLAKGKPNDITSHPAVVRAYLGRKKNI